MKKRLGLLIICLALLALSGCACKHEWTAADCLKPQVCAKCGEEGAEKALGHDWAEAICQAPKTCRRCGETEGQALEHDWAEAACQTPETCRLCGETQGEALGHSFGDWSIEGTQMTHVCEVCGETESTEVDRETFFKDNIVGGWDYYAARVHGQTYTPYTDLSYNNNFYYLDIMEDGTLDIYQHSKGTLQRASWEFKEYKKDNELDVYSFTLHFEDGSEGVLLYVDGDGIYLFMNQSDFILFRENDDTAAALVNTYVGFDEGELYTLSLKADRSFTGNLDGEIQGTWWLSNEKESWGSHIYLYFSYAKDGEQKLLPVGMYLGSPEEEIDIAQYIQKYGDLPSFELPNKRYVDFEPIEESGVQALRDALEESGKQIAGAWNSTEKSIYSDSGSDDEGPCTDYTITFSEDGTFTSNLEDLPAGAWAIERVDHYTDYKGDTFYAYKYTLTAEGIDHAYARLGGGMGDGELNMYYYSDNSGSISGDFVFTRMTREQINQLTEQAVGTWNCISLWDGQGKCTMEGSTAYSITLAEDNTFSGNMDGKVAGTWWVVSESSEWGAQLAFLFDSSEFSDRVSIDQSGNMTLSWDIDGSGKHFEFTQLSREQIDQLTKKAAGTWTSYQVRSWDEQEQEIVEESTAYSITLAEDGTFSGNLEGEIAGTWCVDCETPERGLELKFGYDSMKGRYYILSIDSSGTLSIPRDANGAYKHYDMRKSS